MPTDPVDRAADENADLYEVSTWEPRSPMDRVAVAVHSSVVTGSKLFLVALGLVILVALFAVTGLSLIADPVVSALVALSVLPALALAAYIWYADITTGEPLSVLAITFVLAVLFAGFAGVINTLGMALVAPVAVLGSELLVLAIFFFVVVGPVEEAVKLLAVRLFAFNHHRFDAVIDGAVYGAVAGLGFATIENAIYITGVLEGLGGFATDTATEAGSITAARTLAGPGHVLYSAIAGYYLGLAKFNPSRSGPLVAKGLLVAALFHATYNLTVGIGASLISVATPLGTFGGLLVYVLGFQSVVAYYLYRKLSRYRRAYRANGAADAPADPAPQRTEFEPGRETADERVGTDDRGTTDRHDRGGEADGRSDALDRSWGQDATDANHDHRDDDGQGPDGDLLDQLEWDDSDDADER